MIENDSTLASFPLTLTKQIARNSEISTESVRQEVEESIESGFRSEERKALEESDSPLAGAQPTQDGLSPNDDPSNGSGETSTEDSTGDDQPVRMIGIVVDDLA